MPYLTPQRYAGEGLSSFERNLGVVWRYRRPLSRNSGRNGRKEATSTVDHLSGPVVLW